MLDFDNSWQLVSTSKSLRLHQLKGCSTEPFDRIGTHFTQAWRHVGGHSGAVPPQMTACAPQTKIVPRKINRFGASGVQIEALDSQNNAYRRRIREQELFFRDFCGLTPDFTKLWVYFGTKTFFF